MLLAYYILYCSSVWIQSAYSSDAPNILVLLVDDLGIGDIGCYGNKTIKTPNIDRLCHEGVKLNHNLAAAPMCTPSRAAFLTGRYPARFGLVGGKGTSRVLPNSFGSGGLPQSELTWVKILSQHHGYRAGLFGKWHQGWDKLWWGDHHHGPLSHGFDYFYGLAGTLLEEYDGSSGASPFLTLPDRQNKIFYSPIIAIIFLTEIYLSRKRLLNSLLLGSLSLLILWFLCTHYRLGSQFWWRYSPFLSRRFNSVLFRNKTVVEQPIQLNTLSQRLTKDALQFLESSHESNHPFLLFYSFPQVHTPMFPAAAFRNTTQHGSYGDSIVEVDHIVGKILDKIDELRLTEKFIIYFTSDHGGHQEAGLNGGYNGNFSGGKGISSYEGGIRVPAIFRWTGTLPAGTNVNGVTSHLDFLPTILKLIDSQVTSNVTLDGRDISGLLRSADSPSPHSVLLHHCGHDVHGMTVLEGTVPYKVHLKRPHFIEDKRQCLTYCDCYDDNQLETPLVYNLSTDPGEVDPLPLHNPIVKSVLGKGLTFLTQHQRMTSYPASQFLKYFNVRPYPWLQPCCSLNFCQCQEISSNL